MNKNIERSRNLALFGMYKSNKEIGDMAENLPPFVILAIVGVLLIFISLLFVR